MSRFIPLRLVLPALLAATLLPAAAHAQSDSSQSVAEAARKAREKKKNAEKPVKVITDDTLEVKKGDVQSATAEEPRIPGSPETSTQPAAASANTQGPKSASDEEKTRATLKERVALKEKIKNVQGDLDLLQREYQLDQDSYYSQVDYAKDTAGKEKLDAEKQKISDKQQELDQLKTQLAALPESQEPPAAAPPQS
jgi:hypothetical protein